MSVRQQVSVSQIRNGQKLGGIENRNGLSHFQRGLDAVPRRRLAQRTRCLCNDMKVTVIIIHDIVEREGCRQLEGPKQRFKRSFGPIFAFLGLCFVLVHLVNVKN
jgi:hypothetical protein